MLIALHGWCEVVYYVEVMWLRGVCGYVFYLWYLCTYVVSALLIRAGLLCLVLLLCYGQ